MGKARPRSLPPEGDLPAPDTLAAYKNISAEVLDKILAEFAAEAAHQRALDVAESERKSAALGAQIAFARRGQVFGLTIGMAAIVAGAATASTGHEWAGGVIGGGGVIGLVAVFVLGRAPDPGTEPEPADPPADA